MPHYEVFFRWVTERCLSVLLLAENEEDAQDKAEALLDTFNYDPEALAHATHATWDVFDDSVDVEEARECSCPRTPEKRMDTPLKITVFMGRGECQTHGRFS
jgi:hypothetical protein